MDKNLFTAENLKSIGIAGLLALILWASMSGVFVWSAQYKEAQAQIVAMKAERDSWMKVALEGTRLSSVTAQMSGKLPPTTITEMKTEVQPKTPAEAAMKLDKISEAVEPGMVRTPLITRIQRGG